jgi:hypothetical protein
VGALPLVSLLPPALARASDYFYRFAAEPCTERENSREGPQQWQHDRDSAGLHGETRKQRGRVDARRKRRLPFRVIPPCDLILRMSCDEMAAKQPR